MAKIFGLIALAAVISAAVICRPNWLAENQFLLEFVNHEVLGLMAVILTVTLASVANLHMAFNRIVMQKFKGNEELIDAANGVKLELKDNAWYIFWGFIITVVVLLIKGLNMGNETVLAISHGVVVWVLFLFIFCMYDIYKVVFGIVDLEMAVGGSGNGTEDYTSDSPDIGKP